MAKYYINRADPFAKGLKLELSQEGKNYPIKNVTLWNDHPRYAEFAAGKELDFEIYEKDSGNPNPNKPGSNYIDRSVSKYDTPQKKDNAPVTEMAIKTHVSQEIAPVKEALRAIIDHLGIEKPVENVPGTSVPYPTEMHGDSSTSVEDSTPF
jgi:hypothetical protein